MQISNRDFDGIQFNRDAGGGVRITDFREVRKTMNSTVTTGENYMPEKDVIKKLKDGRQIQLAVAGVPMNPAEARELGLIDESGKTLDTNGVIEETDPVVESESNETEKSAPAPAANKAKTPTKNK